LPGAVRGSAATAFERVHVRQPLVDVHSVQQRLVKDRLVSFGSDQDLERPNVKEYDPNFDLAFVVELSLSALSSSSFSVARKALLRCTTQCRRGLRTF